MMFCANKLPVLLLGLSLLAATAGQAGEPSPAPAPKPASTNSVPNTNGPLAPGQARLLFSISGMTCEGCAGGLRAELQAAPGVKSAAVSLKDKQAVVVCETNRVTAAQLLKTIKEAGFEGKLAAP